MKYRIKETGVIVEDTPMLIQDVRLYGLTLETYEEPVKKLYAYQYNNQITFHINTVENIGAWRRVPEYDITYPKENV